MAKRGLALTLVFAALLGSAPAARAQFAVIDVASLTQLISQLQTLEQQVETARNQLAQAQAEFQAMTGGRGMQQLLGGTVRNYLPASWGELESAVQSGGGAYPALAAELHNALRLGAVLSAGQLAALPPAAGAQLQAGRESAALLQALAHQGLANTSSRFAAIQQLIDAIGGAADQKAILDLQARIAAEGGMLQNERTKLEVLYQGAQARQWTDAQRLRELVIAGHGQFDNRFQPHP